MRSSSGQLAFGFDESSIRWGQPYEVDYQLSSIITTNLLLLLTPQIAAAHIQEIQAYGGDCPGEPAPDNLFQGSCAP
jgi:hypothetical protein